MISGHDQLLAAQLVFDSAYVMNGCIVTWVQRDSLVIIETRRAQLPAGSVVVPSPPRHVVPGYRRHQALLRVGDPVEDGRLQTLDVIRTRSGGTCLNLRESEHPGTSRTDDDETYFIADVNDVACRMRTRIKTLLKVGHEVKSFLEKTVLHTLPE